MDQREEFVLESLRRQTPFRELCRKFGISAKTGYKWVERFQAGGLPALRDLSTRPRTAPSGLAEDVVCRIVALKNAHPAWGPRKIMQVHLRLHGEAATPSESSFKRVLEKAGLVERRRPARAAADAGRIQSRRQAQAPNQVWTVDFKGWWRTGDGRRCDPLTIRDAHSRFVLCADPVPRADTASVRARFERAFAEYGLPETIRSDNGPPFAASAGLLGLSRLSAWWLALGVSLDRIDPGRPDQNGAHERMHRDIAAQVQARARGTLQEQAAALETWRREYNEERPHEALGNRTPAQAYARSGRAFAGTPARLDYPAGHAERTVQRCGTISVDGWAVFVSTALAGWNLGLAPEGEHATGVWFGKLRLGTLDARTRSFSAASPAVEMPP
jgi:transposase InsO family protein